MAWLEPHRTSGHFHLYVRWRGKKLSRTLKTTHKKEAEAILHRVEENITLVDRGRLELPDGANVLTFLLSDGKLSGVPQPEPQLPKAPATLCEIVEGYLLAVGNGSLEPNSWATVQMHLRHVRRKFRDDFLPANLNTTALQDYVNTRVRCKGKKKIPLSPATLRKEITSFRACWNWAVQAGLVAGPFPNQGIRFPKREEKAPFQTRAAIERIIARGGLSERETKALWEGLFLSVAEISEFLEYVGTHAAHPWIYPMVLTAAHTGMRRSELLRLRIEDADFASKTLCIRERKRVKGARTTRRVPMSPQLEQVLQDWLSSHPGGSFLFAQTIQVERSKKKRTTATPITRDEAHDHFQRTLAESKWAVVRGWHVLRHSFASNLAAKGIDQRVIDDFLGHQTEEQRRRYRHLFPDQQRQAICTVFETVPASVCPILSNQ